MASNVLEADEHELDVVNAIGLQHYRSQSGP